MTGTFEVLDLGSSNTRLSSAYASCLARRFSEFIIQFEHKYRLINTCLHEQTNLRYSQYCMVESLPDGVLELILRQRLLKFEDVRKCLFLKPFLTIAARILALRSTIIVSPLSISTGDWETHIHPERISILPPNAKSYVFYFERISSPIALQHQDITIHINFDLNYGNIDALEDKGSRRDLFSEVRRIFDFENNSISITSQILGDNWYIDTVWIMKMKVTLFSPGTLKLTPSIISLDISNGSRLDIDGFAPNLTQLVLRNVAREIELLKLFDRNKIQTITINRCCREVLDYIVRNEFENLTEFCLDNIGSSFPTTFHATEPHNNIDSILYSSLIRSMPNLKHFSLKDEMLESLQEIEYPSTIESLEITDSNIKTFSFVNSQIRQLNYLNISNNNIHHITFDIPQPRFIEELNLSYNRRIIANMSRFSDIALARFLFSRIRKLYLVECHITNEDLERISDLCEGLFINSNLRHLSLSQNRLLNLRCFKEGFFNQLPLEYLDLSFNKFKTLTDYTFPLSLKRYPYLCAINVRANPIESVTVTNIPELIQ